MKILGIGVDIVENKRLKHSIKKKNFISRLFTLLEIKNSRLVKDKSIYFSKKFAAKESFSKALGTGFRKGLNFKDVEILNDNLGKPYFRLNDKTKKIILKTLKVKNFDIFLSISDEKEYSIAFTIIQAKNV
ncbi:holo-ACP synthase [Candidatus Pelagibacter sp.]|uniref:holo-ACP synthase n=1 Tax=Candidatus Pelagibacter sp. TaxID=2024849 RepID=UPI003F84A442